MPAVRDGCTLGSELCLTTPARSLYIGSRLASASRIGSNLSVVSPSLLARPSPRVPTPRAFPAFRGRRTPLYSIARSRIFRNTTLVLFHSLLLNSCVDITSALYTANADRGDAEARDEALSWWGFSGFHIGTWLNGADEVGREEDDAFELDRDTIPCIVAPCCNL